MIKKIIFTISFFYSLNLLAKDDKEFLCRQYIFNFTGPASQMIYNPNFKNEDLSIFLNQSIHNNDLQNFIKIRIIPLILDLKNNPAKPFLSANEITKECLVNLP